MTGILAVLGLATLPPVGSMLAAGPVATLVGTAVAGGALGSGLDALLAESGVEPDSATIFESALRQGRVVVAVDPSDHEEGALVEAMEVGPQDRAVAPEDLPDASVDPELFTPRMVKVQSGFDVQHDR